MGLVQLRFVPPYLFAVVAMATLLVGGRTTDRLKTLGQAIRGDAQATEAYGSLPLAFESNEGQARAGVRFLARGSGYGLALTRTGAILALHKPPVTDARGTVTRQGRAAGLRLRFLGANEGVRLAAGRPLPGKVNYLLGNDPSKWLTGIDTFGEVRYRGLYPGVDARFYGRQGRLEYDLIVAPGADPSGIGLALSGARTLRLDARGNLLVRLPHGTLVQQRPHIYQLIDGRRQPVAGRYVLHGGERFGFRLGPYDSRRPLVIDPQLAYSTYLGGSDFDNGKGIAVDAAGSAYVTGETGSADFPTTPGAFDMSLDDADAFVTKLAASGASLVYSTYLGGSNTDDGLAVAVDPAGAAYVTGVTFSANFPTTPGAFDASFGAFEEAFVTKLAASGAGLAYSSYLGGSDEDLASGIAVDEAGAAYVTGATRSADFPTTPGAFDTSSNGESDPFVTKVAASGASLVYSTYLGGSDSDRGSAIAIDAAGSAYVTGSTSPDCPESACTDAFVTKLAASGASVVYSTPLGGSDLSSGQGIAVDAAGSAYVTGITFSANFPTTPGAFDTSSNGDADAFVAKLSAVAVVSVHIDIKPGSAQNPINLRSHGLIPVAILSTPTFDARTVVATSVCFGDAGNASQRDCTEAHGKRHVADVNGDGRLDLLFHFEVKETGIDPGDTTACLTGTTREGVDVEGCDSITIV